MKAKIAVAQVDARVGDVPSNLDKHLSIARRAAKRGANIVAFPELSLTGYSLKDLAWDVALDIDSGPVVKALRAESKRISIALGFVESASNHGIYNSAMFIEDGEVKHVHRKIYPPTYGMFEEGRYFSAGSSIAAFDSKWGRFGMLICEDMWHVSLPYLLAMDGAEVIFCPTASPTRVAGKSATLKNAEVYQEHNRTYARLLGSYIVFSNRVGFEDGVNFWGGSSIVGPTGTTVASAKLFDEDMIVGELASEEVRRARRFSRHVIDERPEIVRAFLERHAAARPRR